MKPDPWQIRVLRHPFKQLACTSRQRGKSLVASAMAINTAIIEAPGNILYTARTLRQVGEFMGRVHQLYASLKTARKVNWDINPFAVGSFGEDGPDQTARERADNQADEEWSKIPQKAGESVFTLKLANGSRIIGIPPKEETVRGFTNVKRLIMDEASRIPDEFYHQAGAFLATTRGPMVAFTTPFGKRGWFWEAFEGSKSGDKSWLRTRITALGCEHSDPACATCRAASTERITAAWLQEERERIGERWWRQEYGICFEDAVGQLIPHEQIQAAFDRGANSEPIWKGW